MAYFRLISSCLGASTYAEQAGKVADLEVALLDHKTPYVRWGLWWFWLCALGLAPVFGHVTLTAGEGIKLKS